MPPSSDPGFWMNETSGQLRPVIGAYLSGATLDGQQIAVMRVYLRQWINADHWRGSLVDVLRTSVNEIATRADIARWLDRAADAGCDPL